MNENVYFECRKKAAIHNERLNSRAGAAEILGISESTLAHYELGITKNIPVDVVVMMAEVYNAPELKCIYCKSECPIGKELPIATEAGNIEGITVRMLAGLEDEKIDKIQKNIIEDCRGWKSRSCRERKTKRNGPVFRRSLQGYYRTANDSGEEVKIMELIDRLKEVLKEEFNICSDEELLEAVQSMPELDLGIFVTPLKGDNNAKSA